MAKSKSPRGKGAKTAAAPRKDTELYVAGSSTEQPSDDPLRAYPADPPIKNRRLLILSALLFAMWFIYLAYVALAS